MMERINEKAEPKNKRSVLTFLVFLVISTALWLLIKLSNDYSTQTTFSLQLEEVPADKWISSPELAVKMSLNTDGFHTLRCKMIREPKRVVTIPLNEVPYRQETGNTYSFSSQYVAERIADFLGIGTSDVVMNDDKVYFNMDMLKSKVVPIAFQSDIKTQRQYDVYGIPTIDPSTITIFGPQEVIDTVKSVKTVKVTKVNVNQGFHETVGLDLLGGTIRSNVKEVTVEVNVEKFTEKDIEVPIKVSGGLRVRFFPETMKVKCLVAIKDYASIVPEDFSVAVDRQQLEDLQPLLDVRLASWPQYVQVLSTSPDKVEYLIVQ